MSNLRRGQSRDKKIILFRPKGHRAEKLDVVRETDLAVISALYGDIEYRVFKHGPSWIVDKEIWFLAIEGKPLTSVVSEIDDYTEVDVLEFLKDAWGANVLNNLPEELAEPLRARWASQVTVLPSEPDEDALTPLTKLKANEFLFESNLRQAEAWGKSTDEKTRVQKFVDFVMPALIGAFGMYFVVKQGII